MLRLDAIEIARTADAIASVQRREGLIPSQPDGHADPWDHVESAMALDVGGRSWDAERAYLWLQRNQRHDGAWAAGYRDGRITDGTLDANFCAYAAVGVWHHFLATDDLGFLEELWPTVERAIDFTLELQAPGGEVFWARDASGTPWPGALLTSSSCIYLSLRCAIAGAERLGHERPDWELSAGTLAHAVAHRPGAFEPKDRWSMDWYYPVLAGVLRDEDARTRLAERWDEFVVEGVGVRCVGDRPWVTGAETCELVIALDACGLPDDARRLFRWAQDLRCEDGSYWTGLHFLDGVPWPEERPAWTSAAVLLAADVLEGTSPTSGLFRGDDLPTGVEPGTGLSDRVNRS